MNTDKNDKKEDDLDQVQEKLIREDREKRKEEMPVSGRSVFEIKRIKEKDEKGIDKNK